MSREEDVGIDLFGTNLFEVANHDQHWIITTEKKEDGKQFEYTFIGTEYEAKMAAKSLKGTYRRADEQQ